MRHRSDRLDLFLFDCDPLIEQFVGKNTAALQEVIVESESVERLGQVPGEETHVILCDIVDILVDRAESFLDRIDLVHHAIDTALSDSRVHQVEFRVCHGPDLSGQFKTMDNQL